MQKQQSAHEPGPGIADLMRTLADPTRRALFERIAASGETTVAALSRTATVSQPAVSQHVAVLRKAGLIAERRQGRHVHYRANPEGLAPLLDWLDRHAAMARGRFSALDALLQEMDQ